MEGNLPLLVSLMLGAMVFAVFLLMHGTKGKKY